MPLPVVLADIPPPGPPLGVWVVIVGGSVGFALLLVWLGGRGDRKARALLEEWARAEGLQLLEAVGVNRYGAPKGRFATRPLWQSMFRVRVRDGAGAEREGYVCFGNFFAFGHGKPEVDWPATGS